jgi:5-methyltetrahydrofolate--homocysteine methyltransferase
MDEHKLNALDFFRATKWIRENLPHANVRRVSNVSFSFRGNDTVRANAFCFLVSCDSKRNDDGNRKSRNCLFMMRFQKIFRACEDVILNRRDDATERLLDFAENVKGMRSTEKRFKNGVQEFRKD